MDILIGSWFKLSALFWKANTDWDQIQMLFVFPFTKIKHQ